MLIHPGPFHPRFYSYWANAWLNTEGVTYVFAGRLGGGPALFAVSPDGQVSELPWTLPWGGTTEGWYWDREGWIVGVDGPRLMRGNPFSGEQHVLWDISDDFPDHVLWQVHSSDDGRAHSGSVVRQADWFRVGTGAWHEDRRLYVPAQGALDESQISADGRYLLIKEDDDNRIVTLATNDERRVTNAEGALGHSDCGHGFVIGENDQIGACVHLNLETLEQRPLFSTWNMGHVAVRGDRCLVSNATEKHLAVLHVDSGEYRRLTDTIEGWGDSYDDGVRANLSPCGQRACYMVRGEVHLLTV